MINAIVLFDKEPLRKLGASIWTGSAPDRVMAFSHINGQLSRIVDLFVSILCTVAYIITIYLGCVIEVLEPSKKWVLTYRASVWSCTAYKTCGGLRERSYGLCLK
jgi:hypothetical protein